ncbi:MAG: PorT family protein [Dysgonamonadaceae bacterium]|jgi:hypothetical protein|nr:PorT family protein [Dysgonamonadaceae bacterium]
MKKNLKQMQSHADYGKSAMETGNHSKNGASPKSLTSREKFLQKSISKIFKPLACLAAFIWLAGTVQMYAQETAADKKLKNDLSYRSFRFGLKQGLNISKLDMTNVEGLLPKYNYSAGMMFEFGITRFLSIQPEIFLSPKGFHEKTETPSELVWIVPLVSASEGEVATKYTYNFVYAEIPVSLVFKTPVGFNFGAGAYAAYMLGGKGQYALYQNGHLVDDKYIVKHKSSSFYNIIPKYRDPDNEHYDTHNLNTYREERDLYYLYHWNLLKEENKTFDSFDWGVNFMAEYQMPFGLVIGASYTRGMKNIISGLEGLSAKNSNINIYLGVKF